MGGILETLGTGTPQLLVLLQVFVAMGLGAVIGYDRQASYKPAGLRTHMLVAGAAALFVGLAQIIVLTCNCRSRRILEKSHVRSSFFASIPDLVEDDEWRNSA
jgi:uncharacterized membrane protein YhiD involved in acid resistance